ncbi:MAG: TonB-dependent receptor [Wenzhouxiangellaceae bacterium]|nr:TonB-dependent receptor [Wenzhouxiangellaceae bacterium]
MSHNPQAFPLLSIQDRKGSRRRAALALAIAAALAAGPLLVQAQDDEQPTVEQGEAAELDRVAVTGTRRRDRSVADSNVPIDTISAEILTSTGLTETSAILARVLPSFNFPRPSITDGTDQVRPAQLRGLAPDQTLVLINGKRRHTSALLNLNGSIGRGSTAVDLNLIPPNAIERIEVLRDGASAQYGSDAIAGVINIVLKDQPGNFNVSTTFGQHVTKIDGVPRVKNVSFSDDGTQLNIEPGSDRTEVDGDTVTVQVGGGIALGREGALHVAAQYRDRNKTNRSGFDFREQFPRQADGTLDPRELTFDRINHRFGDPNTEELSVFYNGVLPLGSSPFELYAFGNYADREGDAGGFYRRALDSRNVPEIWPEGFLPLITTDTTDQSYSFGVRGEYDGWFLDSSLVWGENELEFGVDNSVNTSLGPTSPTTFDAGTLTNRHLVFNADASKLFRIGGLPVNIAAGFEYRDEEYEIDAGEEASFINGPFPGAAGSQVFPGFTPESEIDRGRDNWSLYSEIDVDLTARWNAAIALRFEDYSDFGSTLNGKLATRFRVNEALSLRASASTGFRAPSLAQQSFTSIATVFVEGVPTETGTFRPDSDVARALGSPGLEEEESISLSGGFVLTPIDGLNITTDFYYIEIDDRIVLSENLSGPGIEELLAGTGANRARFFFNGIDSETKGVDIVASYDLSLNEFGRLTLNSGFNYTDNEVTDVIAPPPQLAEIGVTEDNLFARLERKRFEDGAPKTKFNIGGTWYYGPFRFNALANRFGETVDPGSSVDSDETLDAKWITDLELSYQANDILSLAVGANNVFDVFPDTTVENNNSAGQSTTTFDRIFPFSGFSPFGFNGRFVYGRVSVNF